MSNETDRAVLNVTQLLERSVRAHVQDYPSLEWKPNPLANALAEIVGAVQQHIVQDGAARFEREVDGWHVELEFEPTLTLCFWDRELVHEEDACPQCGWRGLRDTL